MRRLVNRLICWATTLALALSGAMPAYAQPASKTQSDALPVDSFSLQESDDMAVCQTVPLPEGYSQASGFLTLKAAKTTSVYDLNDLWTSQDGGTSSPYTIKKAGTYKLTDDLTVSSQLKIDAAAKNVTLDFGSYVFHIDSSGDTVPIAVGAANSVELKGSYATCGSAQIQVVSEALPRLIETQASSFTMDNLALHCVPREDSYYVTAIGLTGVYVSSGKATVTNSSVVLDESNQVRTTYASNMLRGVPCGIYVSDRAGEAIVKNCGVKVIGSPMAEPSTEEGANTIGHTFCLYSSTAATTTVSGCNFEADMTHGIAAAICGKSVSLSGNNSLTAQGYYGSYGLWSLAAGGVTVNGPLSYSCPSPEETESNAALYAALEGGFALGSNFSGSALPVLVESSGGKNLEGSSVGTAKAASSAAACLASALGSDAPCKPAASDSSVVFALVEANAPAAVGSKRYSSVEAAAKACSTGGTVTLLKDCQDVSLGDSPSSLVIDLAGHNLSHVGLTAATSLTLRSSAGRGRMCSAETDASPAIDMPKGGSLLLEDVDVVAASAARSVTGISSAGEATIRLVDSNIEASSTLGDASCITATGKTNLAMEGGSLRSFSSHADASVYAIAARGEGSSVSITDADVQVEGTSGLTGGIEVKGDVSVVGSTPGAVSIKVSTSGIGSTVWGVRETLAQATATVRNAKVSVTSARGECAGTYRCLLSGSASTAVQANWDLQGENTFKSVNNTPGPYEESASDEAGSVENVTTGALYNSFSRGLAEVREGETLALRKDVVEVQALSLQVGCVIDLAGHILSLNAGKAAAANAAGEGGALTLSGSSPTVITSSSKGGLLDVQVGSKVESANSSSNGYQGICVNGSGGLQIKGCEVDVRYVGGSTIKPEFTLKGISLRNGGLALSDAAELSVLACENSGDFGASHLKAVCVDAGSPAVAVEEGCKVEASSKAQTLTTGEINTTTGSSFSQSTKILMQIYPDEDSELYKDIQEAFLLNAAFDSPTDTTNNVFGTSVYYMSGVALDNGSYVWAYSDPVPESKVGLKESIVAKYIFVEGYQNIPSEACGIYAGEGTSPSVSIAGAVNATSELGDATGICLEGAGVCNASENARIQASTDGVAYRTVTGELDLRDIIDFSPQQQEYIFYPKNTVGMHIELVLPQAAATSLAKDVEGSTQAAQTEATQTSHKIKTPKDITISYGDCINVTVSGMRSEDGELLPYAHKTTCIGESLADVLSGIDTPAQFTSELGTQYRFMGWGVKYDDAKRRIISPDALDQFKVDTYINMEKASFDIAAYYAPVPQGCHLMTFDVANLVSGCVVPEGGHNTFKRSAESLTMMIPVRYPAVTGISFVFKGWQDEQGNVSTFEAASLTNDVTYSGVFEQVGTAITMTWYVWAQGEEGIVYQPTKRSAVAGGDTMEAANNVMAVGDEIGGEEYSYKLLGWAPRSSDVEPLFTDSLPTAYSSSTYYGVYSKNDRIVTVEFYEDENLYGVAEDLPPSTTVAEAFWNSGRENPFDRGEDEPFRGWSTQQNSYDPVAMDMTTVGSLGSASVIRLYAVFGYLRALVTFVDNDGVTVIDTINARVGMTLSDINKVPTVPKDKQKDFRRWKLEDGSTFSITETIVADPLTVYAVYKGDEDEGGAASNKKSGNSGPSATGSKTAGLRYHSSTSGLGSSSSSLQLKGGSSSKPAANKTRASSRFQASDAGAAAPLSAASLQGEDTASGDQGQEQQQQSQAPVVPVLFLIAAILLIIWRIYALYARRAAEGEVFIEPVPAGGREIRF